MDSAWHTNWQQQQHQWCRQYQWQWGPQPAAEFLDRATTTRGILGSDREDGQLHVRPVTSTQNSERICWDNKTYCINGPGSMVWSSEPTSYWMAVRVLLPSHSTQPPEACPGKAGHWGRMLSRQLNLWARALYYESIDWSAIAEDSTNMHYLGHGCFKIMILSIFDQIQFCLVSLIDQMTLRFCEIVFLGQKQ